MGAWRGLRAVCMPPCCPQPAETWLAGALEDSRPGCQGKRASRLFPGQALQRLHACGTAVHGLPANPHQKMAGSRYGVRCQSEAQTPLEQGGGRLVLQAVDGGTLSPITSNKQPMTFPPGNGSQPKRCGAALATALHAPRHRTAHTGGQVGGPGPGRPTLCPRKGREC